MSVNPGIMLKSMYPNAAGNFFDQKWLNTENLQEWSFPVAMETFTRIIMELFIFRQLSIDVSESQYNDEIHILECCCKILRSKIAKCRKNCNSVHFWLLWKPSHVKFRNSLFFDSYA